MSGLPPTLNAETGTPAHEWAQSTTTAAFARDDPAPAANSFTPPGVVGTTSSVTTPGLEIPGAYPSDTRGAINTQGITEAAKNAVNTVTTTAQQYLPVAQETAAQAAQRAAAAASQATQTASSYLSNAAVVGGSTVRASAADQPHEASLPSTETTGALPQEHVGGAGALPGSVRETAVTKLPDERSIKGDSAIYPTNTYPSTAPPDVLSPASQQSSAISPLAGSTVPATTAFTALAPSGTPHSHPQDTSVTLRDSLPSQEATGQAPYTHQDGAGALPGLQREPDVAVLPAESGGPAGSTAATSAATGAVPRDYSAHPSVPRPGEEAGNESRGLGGRRAGRDAAGGVGALVGAGGEEGVAVLPDERGATGSTTAEGGKGDKLAEMDQAEREARERSRGTQKPEQREAAQKKVSGGSACAYGADVDAPSKDQRGDPDPEEQEQEGGKETQMNLREVNLKPRVHPLGAPDAQWRGVGVGVDSGYTDGEGVDIGRRPGIVETPEQEQGEGYDTDYHPAALHPAPADASAAQNNTEATKGDATKGDATKEGNAEGGEGVGARAEGGEKVKKASFMEKMKGEAKVVMGKLEGKKGVEKVQEGKKMKAGEV
ncbi:uncharacterized protein C8Q71DRAFT_897911 [Rhodofomes roseus]|uniref:Uncharacterized protein n=1 Tax=Rhodofomes roseus TaxID=34475 RepID=A0ABQ8KJB8_9APHY|nr:uncharacterized protein C8Q71DRAFT_897911 [Rhodofomes roseus]KAH9837609.1 hypothetical protein C8Q71DRAFT_897911 [Rhodofomes roseus]